VFLKPAQLTNYDLRWEWYFGEADSVSVGVFAKEFDEPIELGRIEAENEIFTWYNAEEADLEGVEIEFRKDLFFDRWFEWGPDWDLFTLSANVSFIDSEVTLFGPGETAADVPLTGNRGLDSVFQNKRQLTGQSDLLGNLMLSYSNYETGIEGSLAYNYTGERIALVGAVNAPDVIEEARGKLDVLLKYQFLMWQTDLELEFKLQNLLDEEVKWTQGGRVYERYRPGVSYSLGIRMSL
jgi:outer membrane receptor protein involved in Fe transport